MPVLCKDVFPVSERAERGGAAGRVSTAHAFECAKIASDQVRAHAPRGRACKMSCWIEQARSQRSLTAGVNADVHHAEVVVCILQTAGVLRRAVRGAQVRDYYSRTRSRTRTHARALTKNRFPQWARIIFMSFSMGGKRLPFRRMRKSRTSSSQ